MPSCVAGDVYDSSAPSAPAQQLVVQTLLRHAAGGRRGHRHRRQPRPRADLRGLPAADGRGGHHPGRDVPPTGQGRAWSGSPPAPTARTPRSPSCRSCPSGTRCARRRSSPTPRRRTCAPTTSMVRQVVASLTSGFSGDTVNLVMSHVTCVGGIFGGGERPAQSIFEYSVPATHLPGLGALRRARPPAPAADAARPRPGALQRLAARGGLRRAGQHERRLPGRGRPRHPGPGHRHPGHAPGGGCGPSTARSPSSQAQAGGFGDDYLRVYLREPTRAGLRDDTVAILPNALEVRIDPEFAPQPDQAAQGPARLARRERPASCSPTTAPRGTSATRGSRPCSANCTTRSPPPIAPTCRRRADEEEGTAMRPITLDMHGFASFRDEAHVDFSDADFFALVGPTGSGKSTVIDAMTFALYGSVPRWGRKGMVSLALAPTVARGTVKLVFEVDGQRYVVARELRRVGSTVNQRAASLERLADPRGLAQPGDQTFPMAKDLDGVNEAVENAARPEVRGLHPVRGAAPGPVRRLPARQAQRTAGDPAAAARRGALPADDDEGEPAGQRGRAARRAPTAKNCSATPTPPPRLRRAPAPPRPPWPASANGWRRPCR